MEETTNKNKKKKPKKETIEKMPVGSEEWKKWDELCQYVTHNILEYDENMKVPQYLSLRLKGLKRGEFVANNGAKITANYDYTTILCAFKLNRKKIIDSIHRNEAKLKDEKHKINLIMKIVEQDINDVYLRVERARKSQDKAAIANVDNQSHSNATYTKKTKETTDKMKNLF